ncbi:MAG: HAMP domain-containing protein [Lachnospiraceae bacterium]|nr:HAMP domain-containing protein [Lachnospiraceae bacterium]
MVKRQKKHLVHSIQHQLVLILCLSILGTLLVCWIVNLTLSERVYQKLKRNSILKVYSEITAVYESLEDEEAALALEKLATSEDVSPYIFDVYQNGSTYFLVNLYPTMTRMERQQLFQRVAGYLVEYLGYSQTDLERNAGDKVMPFSDREIILQNESYGIYLVQDKRTESQYLELFGALDEDSMVLIRSNYESVTDTVSVFNKLLAEIGVVAVVVSAILMYFLSKRITKPLVEITQIAEKMSELDFDVKYEGDTGTEVDRLGHSINTLSQTLESTISELKGANNELERDIERRSEVDSMRTEFLSNVSHELKTPIALIQGYAEGLKDNINTDEESREFYCDVIIDEAAKMNSMVKKLITLNQMEFGTDQISFERFDLVSLIRTILSSNQILVRQKDAMVVFTRQEPIMVWADEFMIEEVFTNYLTNALNHVKKNGKIEIVLEEKEETVRVNVFNEGNPIPEEDLGRIWDKFYKVDKARTREYGGSGIGLSIVRATMEALHQEYGVYNTEDGVTFWFEVDAKENICCTEAAEL